MVELNERGILSMKLRWVILFFLFGLMLMGTLVLSYLSLGSSRIVSVELPSGAMSSPAPTALQSTNSAEIFIDRALADLPVGQVYHNVPKEMQVGVSEIIEAGIAPQVTEKIKKEIKGRGEIQVQSRVRFNPSATEMKLVVDPEQFKVVPIKAGSQFVSSSVPGKWIWNVTPLKDGENLIAIKATVNLKVPELKISHPVEVEVFSEVRRVDVNWGYSMSQFISTNWKEVIGLIFGSGSLATLFTWAWNRKEKEKAEKAQREKEHAEKEKAKQVK